MFFRNNHLKHKRFQLTSFFLTLSVSSIFLAAAFLAPPCVHAEKVNKLYEVRQKLRKAWSNVRESQDEEKSIRTSIGDINDTISRKEKDLRSYDRQTSRTLSEISGLEKEIDTLASELDERKQYLKEYINFLYKQKYGDKAFALTSATDYHDLARKSKYVSLIANYEGRVIEKYMNDVRNINAKRGSLQTLLDELETNKTAAREKKKQLQEDLSRKDDLLSGIREKQAAYERKIKELEATSQKIQSVVATSGKSKIPEAITGSGFASSKGRLPWPAPGKVLIPFGQYSDAVYNISTFKNGIEIGTEPDDVPKAVAGGRVIYAGAFEGYGAILIIDHGNGYNTLYGNLSEIRLRKNDLLIRGTDLGKITASKLLNTPALYFEIRYNGKPLDPVEWLEKRG